MTVREVILTGVIMLTSLAVGSFLFHYVLWRLQREAARVEKMYQQILKNEPKDVATMERAKRLVRYDKIQTQLHKIRQQHDNAQRNEYEKHSVARMNRVHRDLAEITLDPLPGLEVAKSISGDRYVFFLLKGLTGTPFQGGTYCGMIILSPNYPFQPPKSFVMLSPSGGYFFREGIQRNFHLQPKAKWNPLSSSLRDCFVRLLRDWNTCKIYPFFHKLRVEVLARSSFESCVELCPDFYDLFPAYSSSAEHDNKTDSRMEEWELVECGAKIPIQKLKKRYVANQQY